MEPFPRSRTDERPVVLVVENDLHFRELLKLMLHPLDIEVVAVADLDEARRLLDEPPAVVILDFYLEPRVGPELLDDLPPDVPVLLLTASIETRELLRKYPRIAKALQKPVSERALHEAVLSLIDGSHDADD
jgi:CheY-like chemotaxis protein